MILYKTPSNIIKSLGNREKNHSVRNISHTINSTASSISPLLKEMEAGGILTSENKGRRRVYSLTDLGKELRDIILRLDEVFL